MADGNGYAPRTVIIEADDLGLLYAFNEGIRAAWQHGVLTSTCLRANGYAYEHAVHEVLPRCPGLGVGVHLCLNEAEPVASPARVGRLLTRDGSLRPGFTWLMGLARTREGMGQIERELRAQIEKVLDSGVVPDHLNAHQHVHMIPPIFRLVCRLARAYGIPCVRLARELPYRAGGWRRVQPYLSSNFIKRAVLNRFAQVNALAARRWGVLVTDYFVGIGYTARMNLGALLRGLRAAPCGCVEVLLHPALGPDPRDRRYPSRELYNYVVAGQRRMELDSLCAPELPAFLSRRNWIPADFRSWALQQQSTVVPDRCPQIPPEVSRLCREVRLGCPLWVSQAQPDSRIFAELVLSQTQPGQRVLDLGTGTGILAICLAREGRQVVAADISRAALRTARRNAARNGVELECCWSDLLSDVRGRFDLIAFNPPYGFGPDNLPLSIAKNLLRRVPWVRRQSGLAMPRPVLRYHQRLVARLAAQAPEHLTRGGALMLHVYQSEVSAIRGVLPTGSRVELIHHPELRNRTAGMLIRLPGD